MFVCYEFYAGGGMARIGFGAAAQCLFANDIDVKKRAAYVANHGGAEFVMADIATLRAGDLPGRPDLLWASSPCTDTSAAGHGNGIYGKRSGSVFELLRLVRELAAQGRAPAVVAIENVVGLASRFGRADLVTLAAAIADLGYRVGALVCDAALFVPQSRPRLFIVAVRDGVAVPGMLAAPRPDRRWHPEALVRARAQLSPEHRARWRWWRLPQPVPRVSTLADVLEPADQVKWDEMKVTRGLLAKMSAVNREKVEEARLSGAPVVGAMFQRTRKKTGAHKGKQRVEVRFDGIAGCLRLPKGGSSRQRLLVVRGSQTRSRLITPREAARLMGLPDTYHLPSRAGDALTLLGDGVVVPVVQHLVKHLLHPLMDGAECRGDDRRNHRKARNFSTRGCGVAHRDHGGVGRRVSRGRSPELERRFRLESGFCLHAGMLAPTDAVSEGQGVPDAPPRPSLPPLSQTLPPSRSPPE